MSVSEKLKAELLERLAELEHEQWSHWMQYSDEHIIHEKDIVEFPIGMWNEWLAKAKVAYCDLIPEDRESDRAYSHTFAIAFIILAIAFLSFELGGRVK